MKTRYQKICVKIGSNVLTKPDGTLHVSRMAHLVDQVSALVHQGIEVVLVSSGAVAAGRAVLSKSKSKDPVSQRQLWSALGQVKLISRYSDFFGEQGLKCAQVLTTKENFSTRGHYLNMQNCIRTLLEHQVIPIINENDTISVTELMFTDNDELSGLIASMLGSEALILLTNVDGVYSGSPESPEAQLIEQIKPEELVPNLEISPLRSSFGRGGMLTKFRMAQKVAGDGIAVHVANGFKENILLNLLDASRSEPHTHFIPKKRSTKGVKKWMGYVEGFATGAVVVNQGALNVLQSDQAVSLLPVGVQEVLHPFKKGDLLRIIDPQMKVIGVGVASYDSDKMEKEKRAVKQKPVIHYDYMYLNSPTA